jgi:hypothetical protein
VVEQCPSSAAPFGRDYRSSDYPALSDTEEVTGSNSCRGRRRSPLVIDLLPDANTEPVPSRSSICRKSAYGNEGIAPTQLGAEDRVGYSSLWGR